jgi:hypothetical protein
MELQGSHHIIRAIERRISDNRSGEEAGRWVFSVDGYAINVREQGIARVIKVAEMDPFTLDIKSVIDGTDVGAAARFSEAEEKLSGEEKLKLICECLQEDYLKVATIHFNRI